MTNLGPEPSRGSQVQILSARQKCLGNSRVSETFWLTALNVVIPVFAPSAGDAAAVRAGQHTPTRWHRHRIDRWFGVTRSAIIDRRRLERPPPG